MHAQCLLELRQSDSAPAPAGQRDDAWFSDDEDGGGSGGGGQAVVAAAAPVSQPPPGKAAILLYDFDGELLCMSMCMYQSMSASEFR